MALTSPEIATRQAKVLNTTNLTLTHELVNLISEIDEFKGKWRMLQNIAPERLSALRHVATIESVGSSTRIEGVKLSDREVETLLSNLKQYSFKSRDESKWRATPKR